MSRHGILSTSPGRWAVSRISRKAAAETGANRDAMLEHRIARDLATEIYGTIEALLVDEIRPAIEYLEAASRVTAAELVERFAEDETRRP